MQFWVGITDNQWFRFLAPRKLEEVNFWQPSSKILFSVYRVPIGMPFLFKLKSPYNHIGGGGFFVGTCSLPLHLAWEIFGEKNGASSMAEFMDILFRTSPKDVNRKILCNMITNPIFLEQHNWMEDPPDFNRNVQRGKFYDTSTPAGRPIWQRMAPYFTQPAPQPMPIASGSMVANQPDGYGRGSLIEPRLGQAAFRALVTQAYQRRCAMTGENTLVALDAAHITPYSIEQSHEITNGLLLRADFHKLFDKGLVSVTPDYKIKVSPRIREAYFNGKAYYRIDGQELHKPQQKNLWPDPDRLNWHFKNVYQS